MIMITRTKVQGDLEINFYGKNSRLSRYPSERYCQLIIICSANTLYPVLKPLALRFSKTLEKVSINYFWLA